MPPRTSTAVSNGRSGSTTVTLVRASRSSALPTSSPATAARLLRGPDWIRTGEWCRRDHGTPLSGLARDGLPSSLTAGSLLLPTGAGEVGVDHAILDYRAGSGGFAGSAIALNLDLLLAHRVAHSRNLCSMSFRSPISSVTRAVLDTTASSPRSTASIVRSWKAVSPGASSRFTGRRSTDTRSWRRSTCSSTGRSVT